MVYFYFLYCVTELPVCKTGIVLIKKPILVLAIFMHEWIIHNDHYLLEAKGRSRWWIRVVDLYPICSFEYDLERIPFEVECCWAASFFITTAAQTNLSIKNMDRTSCWNDEKHEDIFCHSKEPKGVPLMGAYIAKWIRPSDFKFVLYKFDQLYLCFNSSQIRCGDITIKMSFVPSANSVWFLNIMYWLWN